MTNKQLLAALRDYSRSVSGRLGEVMAATGAAESTVRSWMERGKPPRNTLIRKALEEFLTKAAAR